MIGTRAASGKMMTSGWTEGDNMDLKLDQNLHVFSPDLALISFYVYTQTCKMRAFICGSNS